MSESGRKLDLTDRSEVRGTVPGAAGENQQSGAGERRLYLRIFFRCSGQYARANPTSDRCAYQARCGECGKTVTFPIGPGGTGERFFTVSCR